MVQETTFNLIQEFFITAGQHLSGVSITGDNRCLGARFFASYVISENVRLS
jgi:hypothetical protein